MRILIGYNGSEASIEALLDLHEAGLPVDTEALVLTIAEILLSPNHIAEAEKIASEGVARLRAEFPKWTVNSGTGSGSPSREILAHVESFNPDLIVVGEPRQEVSDNNILIGHTTQTLLAEAPCSVRVSRGGKSDWGSGARLIVGFDGSAGSENAVRTISSRSWPADTQVLLLAVADSTVLGSIGRFVPQMTGVAVETKIATQWGETLAAGSIEKLKKAGLSASVAVRLGHPKDTIITEAESWGADTIFVGPHCAASSLKRFLLGSVSAAVAAHSGCSVEVIRAAELN